MKKLKRFHNNLVVVTLDATDSLSTLADEEGNSLAKTNSVAVLGLLVDSDEQFIYLRDSDNTEGTDIAINVTSIVMIDSNIEAFLKRNTPEEELLIPEAEDLN